MEDIKEALKSIFSSFHWETACSGLRQSPFSVSKGLLLHPAGVVRDEMITEFYYESQILLHLCSPDCAKFDKNTVIGLWWTFCFS